MKGCWLHDWGKWEQYDWVGRAFIHSLNKSAPISEVRQKRVCKKCNKMQDEKVREG